MVAHSLIPRLYKRELARQLM